MKMVVHITKEQLEILINFMENHRSLSNDNTSIRKQDNKKYILWKKLEVMLNSNKHGPSKSVHQWIRLWQSKKTYVRRKLLQRKIEIKKNGSSLIKLSPVEERIWKFAKYKAKKPNKKKSSSSNAGYKLRICAPRKDKPSVDQDQEPSTVPDSLNFTDLVQVKEEPLSEYESISNEEYFYPTNLLTTQVDSNNEPLPNVLSEFESCGAKKNNSSTVLNIPQSLENVQSCIPSVSSTTNSQSPNSCHNSITRNSQPSSISSLSKSKKRKQPIEEKIDDVSKKKKSSVMERIAIALETQAVQSKEQTKLMHQILNILTKQ